MPLPFKKREELLLQSFLYWAVIFISMQSRFRNSWVMTRIPMTIFWLQRFDEIFDMCEPIIKNLVPRSQKWSEWPSTFQKLVFQNGAGGHFEFCPVKELVTYFAKDLVTKYKKGGPEISQASSNISSQRMVTGIIVMTRLQNLTYQFETKK